MTFAEMVTQVGWQVRDANIASYIKTLLNMVIKTILRRRQWSWLTKFDDFALTLNMADYAWPTDCRKILGFITTDGEVNYCDPKQYMVANQVGSMPAQALPSDYTQLGKNVVTFYPTPNANGTLKIRYLMTIPTLADDATDMDTYFPSTYQDVPINGASFLAAIPQNDKTAIQLYQNLFYGGIAEMLTDDNPTPEETLILGSNSTEKISSWLGLDRYPTYTA